MYAEILNDKVRPFKSHPIFRTIERLVTASIPTPMSRVSRKQSERYDAVAKIVILGDSSVGKTNILLRYTSDTYKPAHMPTIGVDFMNKAINIENKRVKLQLWDTAGQERFKTITETYYKGASGIVMVYSVDDRKTFQSINNWVMQINEHTEHNVPKILVANKCDIQFPQRVVTAEEGRLAADKYGIPYLETSAKENINIEEAFQVLGRRVLQEIQRLNAKNGNPHTCLTQRVSMDRMITPKTKKCC